MKVSKIFLALALCLAAGVHGRSNYPNFVPNARNVVRDGQRWRALGHPTPTSGSTSTARANPFGVDAESADRQGGSNQAKWTRICNVDSDGDGILNKDELCDPGCNRPGQTVACVGGAILTHPGFRDIVVDGEVIPDPTDLAGSEFPETGIFAHGLLMMAAWLLCAPAGILRAIFYKKRPGKPVWFRDHKILMSLAVGFTFLGIIAIVSVVKFEPLSQLFAASIGGGDDDDDDEEEEEEDDRRRLISTTVRYIFGQSSSGSTTHVFFGLLVVLVSVIQPLSGIFRAHLPKPGEQKSTARKLWEIQHEYTGRIGLLCAFIAVYTGLEFGFTNGKGTAVFLAIVFALVGAGTMIYVFFFRASHIEGLKKKSMVLAEAEPVEQKMAAFANPQSGSFNNYPQSGSYNNKYSEPFPG